ncbi:hypothetical protein [Glutamicibacter sp. V16R2B1]|uniref:hypothetical protein n=1 Tax=Glutamicibacter sp. V16R2B1 TaxID=2036207 RepID=UPI0010FE1AFF|nr:hypothetical protein [Glutamicibacter sp. V16R2B1]MCK9901281.1 hypothetical protein [Frankia sp. Cpl3]TLK47469.1 hypothetical protein FDN03_15795 [Glutamicibacter sp. V16R2B1]
MSNHGGMSLHCVAFRVTKLALDGSTPADVGVGSSYVSDKLMKIDFNPELDEGPEIANRGASGQMVQVFKMKDLLKRINMSVEIGALDPELEFLLSGGTILTSNASPLTAMGALGSSTATTGGTMTAATYGYKVAARSAYGSTIASAEKTQVVPSGTSTNTVTLTWTTVSGAAGYDVFGRTSGGPWGLIAKIGQAGSPTWTDTGGLTPNADVLAPTADTSGVAPNGYAYPAVGAESAGYGVSIEAWSRNIAEPGNPQGYPAGQQIGEAPWIRWVFPRVFLQKGDRTLDGNPLGSVFNGWAEENSSWGNGPFNDWLYPSSRLVQYAYESDGGLPTAGVGRIAIPAQV